MLSLQKNLTIKWYLKIKFRNEFICRKRNEIFSCSTKIEILCNKLPTFFLKSLV